MVAVAEHRTLDEVLQAVAAGIAICKDVVLTRTWLFAPGDLCETCRFATECPRRESCLHLVASAGNVAEGRADNLHGAFRRFPSGVRKIGRVAATGEPLLLANLAGDEDWIVDVEWFRRERISSFAAQPLVFRGEVLGVLAVFDRRALGEHDFRWLRVFADHAAVSIANARAFEEIDRLHRKLQGENEYLLEEVGRASDVELIAESDGMRRVAQQVSIVADSDASVLITGESWYRQRGRRTHHSRAEPPKECPFDPRQLRSRSRKPL